MYYQSKLEDHTFTENIYIIRLLFSRFNVDFWNFYIVQNGRSAAIFTAKSYWITESHQILPNLTISNRISPYLTKGTKSKWISPQLAKFHWILQNLWITQNLNTSLWISPNLIESRQISPKLNVMWDVTGGMLYFLNTIFFVDI